jgi:DNA replication protein DnaC
LQDAPPGPPDVPAQLSLCGFETAPGPALLLQVRQCLQPVFGLELVEVGVGLAELGVHSGHTVLFTTAVDIVNTLAAAQSTHRLKAELKKYISPSTVLVDELGYLPIDKTGADLLFQVFSQRYETGSTIVTTNQAYKDWAKVFSKDATLTSVVLDRLLHHAETVTIEGKSYRMKDQIEEP